MDVHYVPGEHDLLDEEQGKLYRERYGRGSKGAGWYSFDADGVHFIGLVNVVDLKAGGLGNLGNAQLDGLADDVKGPPAVNHSGSLCLRISRSGRLTRSGAGARVHRRALGYLKNSGSVTVLNGHIHQVMQKGAGN